MTDPRSPDPNPDDPNPDDRATEAASAYLDGAATAEEIALVESDGDLQREVATMAAVGRLLPVGDPSPDLRDEHVTTALAEFDTLAASGGASVTDLAAARAERPWHARIPLGAVAAAVLLIALVAGVSLLDSGADDADTASRADTADDSASLEATTSGGSADGETFPDDSGVAAGSAPDQARLAFTDNDALADYVSRQLGAAADAEADEGAAEPSQSTPDSTTAQQESSAACDPVAAAGVGDAPVVAVIPAVVAGEAVTAVVADEGVRRLVVVDDATCAVVDDRPLPG